MVLQHHAEYMSQSPALRRNQLIRMSALTAPLCAQIIMVIALLVQHQWLFAMMIGSSCIATAASLYLQYAQRSTQTPTALEPANTSSSPHLQRRTELPDIPAQTFTDLMRFTQDAAPMRTICHAWSQADPHHCIAIVGQQAHGEPVQIDITQQGPHAMIAGTTGSGKSVLLQDWILSLACLYPPTMVQFILLDFKGGSTFDTLKQLPHVRGCVNDLHLSYATRALRAMEQELQTREQLANTLHCANLMDHEQAPARLIIVIDEFHMLHESLPDYMDRIMRIASLGRSLGMHVIACTQNPLGQINTTMKANINARICLRVRDAMQSQEMINCDDASRLHHDAPGMAFFHYDDHHTLLRCAINPSPSSIVRHIQHATQFYEITPPPPLFTPILPEHVRSTDLPTDIPHNHMWIGLADNGITCTPFSYDPTQGNLAIIGARGRGTHELITALQHATTHHAFHIRYEEEADAYLDPINMDEQAQQFRKHLHNDNQYTVFSLRSSRRLHIHEDCAARIIFPTGERVHDLAEGIPAQILSQLTPHDMTIQGRAVYIQGPYATIIQCITST